MSPPLPAGQGQDSVVVSETRLVDWITDEANAAAVTSNAYNISAAGGALQAQDIHYKVDGLGVQHLDPPTASAFVAAIQAEATGVVRRGTVVRELGAVAKLLGFGDQRAKQRARERNVARDLALDCTYDYTELLVLLTTEDGH
eukprot:SAG31_NODE_4377_length_3293_cov_1.309017_2_plen_143_part_00